MERCRYNTDFNAEERKLRWETQATNNLNQNMHRATNWESGILTKGHNVAVRRAAAKTAAAGRQTLQNAQEPRAQRSIQDFFGLCHP
jgi:hypothetical protein